MCVSDGSAGRILYEAGAELILCSRTSGNNVKNEANTPSGWEPSCLLVCVFCRSNTDSVLLWHFQSSTTRCSACGEAAWSVFSTRSVKTFRIVVLSSWLSDENKLSDVMALGRPIKNAIYTSCFLHSQGEKNTIAVLGSLLTGKYGSDTNLILAIVNWTTCHSCQASWENWPFSLVVRTIRSCQQKQSCFLGKEAHFKSKMASLGIAGLQKWRLEVLVGTSINQLLRMSENVHNCKWFSYLERWFPAFCHHSGGCVIVLLNPKLPFHLGEK